MPSTSANPHISTHMTPKTRITYPRSPFIGFFLSFVVSALCAPLRLATVRPMNTNFRPTLFVALVILAGAPLAGAPSRHYQHHAAPPTVSAAAAQQIQDVKQAASTLATPDAARAAGDEPVLGWIPMMGTHWVHGPRMLQGKPAVTRTTPSQLMCFKGDYVIVLKSGVQVRSGRTYRAGVQTSWVKNRDQRDAAEAVGRWANYLRSHRNGRAAGLQAAHDASRPACDERVATATCACRNGSRGQTIRRTGGRRSDRRTDCARRTGLRAMRTAG